MPTAPEGPPEGGTEGGTEARFVYAHAPFCARRCFYCDFAVQVRRQGGGPDWLRALSAELHGRLERGEVALADRFSTVYVGGGTPSLLAPEAMAGFGDLLGRNRLAGGDVEWTAEANPESFTPDLASAWRHLGVNRVSLGIQTFHEPSLRWMGRLHGGEGGAAAVEVARRAGFSNVSVDLIFGLPKHLGRDWREDLQRALDLDVPHISLYGLTVEGGTALGRWVREGRETPVDEAMYEEEYLLAAEMLGAAGYDHYEVSNFARAGYASRHNRAYWDGSAYLGLGNSAHSYLPPHRLWNVRDWETYRARTAAGDDPTEGREAPDASARRLERIWLALRTKEGLAIDPAGRATDRVIDGWRAAGLAVGRAGRIRLTPRGWLLLDELAVALDAVLPDRYLDL